MKGFTLIEVMVSMLIISVGMLATGGLLMSSIKTNAASEKRMDASALAQSVLSGVSVNATAAGYIQGAVGNPGEAAQDVIDLLGDAFDADGLDGKYNPTVVMVPTPTVTNTFSSIIVTLTWDDHGSNKSVEVRSGVVAN